MQGLLYFSRKDYLATGTSHQQRGEHKTDRAVQLHSPYEFRPSMIKNQSRYDALKRESFSHNRCRSSRHTG